MIVEDFIMKMIRLGVEFIAKALGLAKEGMFLQSESLLSDGLEDLTGLSMDSLQGITVESLDLLFRNQPGNLLVAAMFLKGYGAVRKERGDMDSYIHAMEKSRLILSLLEDLNLPEIRKETEQLEQELASLER